MDVWEVFGKRTPDDRFGLVGTIKAPDAGMALIFARETHFRHKEGVQYAVRRRGGRELHIGPYHGDVLGGLTDRAYRRQEAYAGVGGRLKRMAEDLAAKGVRIDRPRPPLGLATHRASTEAPPSSSPDRDIREVRSEDIAAHGTAG